MNDPDFDRPLIEEGDGSPIRVFVTNDWSPRMGWPEAFAKIVEAAAFGLAAWAFFRYVFGK